MEKRRSPPVAVLLSLLEPGLGQLYAGRPGWALGWWLAALTGLGLFLFLFAALETSLARAYYTSAAWMAVVWLGSAVQAGWLAGKAGEGYRLKLYNLGRIYLLCWLVGMVLPVAGLVRLTRSLLLTSLIFEQNTMLPELLPGDVLTIDRRPGTRGQLQRGQVVALPGAGPRSVTAWRVVGLEGERVVLYADALEIAGTRYPFQEGQERVFHVRDERGEWQEQKAREVVVELEGRRLRLWLSERNDGRRTGQWQAGPGQLVLLGDNLAVAEPRLAERRDILGRVILVRLSRDPRSRAWRPERRRLPVP